MTQDSRKRTLHPAQIVVIAFGAAVLLGTLLLLLPISTASGESTDLVTALFTSVSAVCLTGLTVVETGTYWSSFGHLVIMLLIQVGGLGIVAFATLVGLLIAGRISLRDRMNTITEAKIIGIDSMPALLRTIMLVYFGFEAALAVFLAARLHLTYDFATLDAISVSYTHLTLPTNREV